MAIRWQHQLCGFAWEYYSSSSKCHHFFFFFNMLYKCWGIACCWRSYFDTHPKVRLNKCQIGLRFV